MHKLREGFQQLVVSINTELTNFNGYGTCIFPIVLTKLILKCLKFSKYSKDSYDLFPKFN